MPPFPVSHSGEPAVRYPSPGPFLGSSLSRRMADEHRNVSSADQLVSDAAQRQATNPPEPVRGEHDETHPLRPSIFEDGLGCVSTDYGNPRRADALLSHLIADPLQVALRLFPALGRELF